jgi:hypothetical protein
MVVDTIFLALHCIAPSPIPELDHFIFQVEESKDRAE